MIIASSNWNVRDFTAFAIDHGNFASDTPWGVRRNLSRNGFALLTCRIVARAIHASRIHKAVTVLNVKKVARHGLNLVQFPH